jgi:hypothetical protein
MTRERFGELFASAVMTCIDFTQQFIVNELPVPTRFLVRTNASHDIQADGTSLTTYPDDSSLPELRMTGLEAIDFLWRDERVPQWIDVSVVAADQGFTDISLTCCGRYVAEEERMYYQPYGRGPFGVKGPALPPEWDDKKREKFDLHWRRDMQTEKPQ